MTFDVERARLACKSPGGILMVTRHRNGETDCYPDKSSEDFYAAAKSLLPAALDRIEQLERTNAALLAELGQHFAVSITARALCADEALMGDLRDIIDAVGNGTPEQRIASLPERIKAVH